MFPYMGDKRTFFNRFWKFLPPFVSGHSGAHFLSTLDRTLRHKRWKVRFWGSKLRLRSPGQDLGGRGVNFGLFYIKSNGCERTYVAKRCDLGYVEGPEWGRGSPGQDLGEARGEYWASLYHSIGCEALGVKKQCFWGPGGQDLVEVKFEVWSTRSRFGGPQDQDLEVSV